MPFINRRDVYTAVLARSIGLLGDEMATIALVLRAQHDGAGTAAVAALLVAGMAPLVLMAPLAGRVVDRHDSRHLLVGVALAQAVVCAALVCVTAVPAVLALVALLGVGQSVTATTWQALLPAMAGPDDTPRALGLSQSFFAIGGIAAPALAGVLFTLSGARLPLILDVVSFLLVALGGRLIATRRVNGTATGEAEHVTGGGFAIIWARPPLRALIVMLGVFITLGAMVNVVDVFLVVDTLHADGAWYGALAGTWSAGMVVGGWYTGRRLAERMPQATVVASVVLGAALFGYSLVPSVVWLLPLSVAGGLGNGALNVLISAQAFRYTPESALGRVSATIGAVANGAQISSYVLGGVLAVVVSPRTIFAVGGALSLVAVAALGRSVLRPDTSATPMVAV